MAASKIFRITVQRTVKTEWRSAWSAWADPALLSRWFTTNARQDFRVGGRYENGDGDSGEFLKIVPDKLIRFTWENKQHQPGSIVQVELAPQSKTRVVVRLRHEKLKTKKDADDLKQGCSWALDSLQSFLERGAPIAHADWLRERQRR